MAPRTFVISRPSPTTSATAAADPTASAAGASLATQNLADSDYVLFADYWFAPNGQVWAVLFVVCDRTGDWVIVDLQNNHHEDFQLINPKTLADCDRLVLEKIKKRLR